jgi:HlyD family secretion protein
VNVIGDFDTPPDALGDGYRVEARIVVWQGNDVLKVPSSALFRREGDWSVFMLDNGRARRRAVQIGRRNARDAEVVGGLEEGTVVILHPTAQVDDGVRVEPL